MGQQKFHKKCVQDTINKVKETHSCYKEYPIVRNGNYHFIDVVGHPHPNKKHLKSFATECESGSSKLQQESNKLDLIEFKGKKNEPPLDLKDLFKKISELNLEGCINGTILGPLHEV